MSELKPCPFCKVSAPKLEDHITITTPYFFVRCQECGASAKVCRTKGEAVDVWNHRPLEDELVVALGGVFVHGTLGTRVAAKDALAKAQGQGETMGIQIKSLRALVNCPNFYSTDETVEQLKQLSGCASLLVAYFSHPDLQQGTRDIIQEEVRRMEKLMAALTVPLYASRYNGGGATDRATLESEEG